MKNILHGWGLAMVLMCHLTEGFLASAFIVIGIGLLIHANYLGAKELDERFKALDKN